MEHRLHTLKAYLEAEDLNMCFIQSKENVFYLTNFYTDPHERLMGLFLFSGHVAPFFICPQMEVNQAKAAGWKGEIVGYADHEDPWIKIQSAIASRKLGKIEKVAIEKEVVPYSRVEALSTITPNAHFVSIEEALNRMRVVKDHDEINILRKAAELADFGVQVGIHALKTGVTEMEVLATIEYELKKKGIREMSFSTMVLFGEKSGDPHGNPGLKTLSEGDFVLFDLGVVLDGYCSDITRTYVYKSFNRKQEEIYNTVLKAQKAALEASKPGVRIGDLDQIARTVITDAGYGDFFPHRLGHGLGINVHEYPSMSHTNDEILQEGMVYTIEPGIYVPQVGGVRIEDDVLITKEGHETLTNLSKEFTVLQEEVK
ncbi:M24 family metallopeptidase [Bacillus weihaiensis]|uniref:M24 family metallopeptidase n=1 Tax=Bacillus weihaiensis TaxID=1547283 RepID=UPI002353989E|nr:Xaa-Pro peptidase family protein [Bacillus weihaiensis]